MKPSLQRLTPYLLLALTLAVVRLAYLWQVEKLEHEVDRQKAQAVWAEQQAKLLRAELLNRAYARTMLRQSDNVQNVLGPLADWLKKDKQVDFKSVQALLQANPTSSEAKLALLKALMDFQEKWLVSLGPAMARMTPATERLFEQQREFEAERDRILSLGRTPKSPNSPAR